jgi:hypothetical protein
MSPKKQRKAIKVYTSDIWEHKQAGKPKRNSDNIKDSYNKASIVIKKQMEDE